MIVNKEMLSNLSKDLIESQIQNAKTTGFEGPFNMTKLVDGVGINFMSDVIQTGSLGAVMIIYYKDKELFKMGVENCLIFNRKEFEQDKNDWIASAVATLITSLSKMFAEYFVETDMYVNNFLDNIGLEQGCSLITISYYTFKAIETNTRNSFTVFKDDNPIYEVKKVNALGITTAEGWQAYSKKNIISDFTRVIAKLSTTDEMFKYPVSL